MDYELIIFWSDVALRNLEDINSYYISEGQERYSKKILSGILDKTENLVKFPKLGQKEELLLHFKNEFRYLVQKQYKIIYWIKLKKKRIEIVHIFDTRQNPTKISEFK